MHDLEGGRILDRAWLNLFSLQTRPYLSTILSGSQLLIIPLFIIDSFWVKIKKSKIFFYKTIERAQCEGLETVELVTVQ